MKITRSYHNFRLELDRDDFQSMVGQMVHEHIKSLPRGCRTWNFGNFSWVVDKKYYQDIIEIKNRFVSFSEEEMLAADNEFNNNWIIQHGYSI